MVWVHMSASDASSLSLWSWLSLLGLLLVIIGVIMEGAEAVVWTFSWFRRKRLSVIWSVIPEPHIPKWTHRLDHVGWFVLVVGLALETWGHIRVTDITGRENHRLNWQLNLTTMNASEANERAKKEELDAKQLEIKLNETKTQLADAEARLNGSIIDLRNDNEPMKIGEIGSFINELKQFPSVSVELRNRDDNNARETAGVLYLAFNNAGWRVINTSNVGDLDEKGIVIGYNGDIPSTKAAKFLRNVLTERNVPSMIFDNDGPDRARGVPTNAIIVAVCLRPDHMLAQCIILRAKEQELFDQSVEIWSKLKDIESRKYKINSKSFSDAQIEDIMLTVKYVKLMDERTNLLNQAQAIYEQIESRDFPTNSTPGLYDFQVMRLTPLQ